MNHAISLRSAVWMLMWMAALCGAIPGRAVAAPAVELVMEGRELEPSSTLEFRFDREMVTPEQLGVPAEQVPVVVQPALPGKFTWLSRRSGVFVPDQAPAMGVTYGVELAPGLRDAAGKPVKDKFRVELTTPAFHLRVLSEDEPQEQTPPAPRVKLQANLALDLESARQNIQFVAEDGRKVRAAVEYATNDDYFGGSEPEGDWTERWHSAIKGETPAPANIDDERPPAKTYQYRLIAVPTEMLSAGTIWSLEVQPGVRALQGGTATKKGSRAVLGEVKPFALESLLSSSYLNSGRSLTVEFGQQVAEEVTELTAHKYFRITPEVPGLRAEMQYRGVVFSGAFQRGQEYRLEMSPELRSDSGQAYAGKRVHTFKFNPVAPRAYLPVVTGHQIQSGRRKLPVVSVNLQKLRIVAKLVAPTQAAQAVAAFEKYRMESPTDFETYQPLPANAVSGKVLFDRMIDLPSAEIDRRQETVLDWTEILGQQASGTIFLTVSGEPIAGIGTAQPGAQALVQLTDLGVLWKGLGDSTEISIFSMATGKPVPGARVQLIAEDFQSQGEAVTDADGRVRLPVTSPAWLYAQKGSDVHVMEFGESAQELPSAAFRLPREYTEWGASQPTNTRLAFIYTDRPLYKPLETARVRGYVRSATDSGLKMAARERLLLLFSRRNEETAIPVATDEAGAFEAELPVGASVGDCRLELAEG